MPAKGRGGGRQACLRHAALPGCTDVQLAAPGNQLWRSPPDPAPAPAPPTRHRSARLPRPHVALPPPPAPAPRTRHLGAGLQVHNVQQQYQVHVVVQLLAGFQAPPLAVLLDHHIVVLQRREGARRSRAGSGWQPQNQGGSPRAAGLRHVGVHAKPWAQGGNPRGRAKGVAFGLLCRRGGQHVQGRRASPARCAGSVAAAQGGLVCRVWGVGRMIRARPSARRRNVGLCRAEEARPCPSARLLCAN